MRRITAVAMLAVLMVSMTGCSLLGSNEATRSSTGIVLTGRVVMPVSPTAKSVDFSPGIDDASPVKGATISVDGEQVTVKTDANGYFSITGLSPLKRYVITAALPDGYDLATLHSFGAPDNDNEPMEVSIATTAAVKSMQTLAFKSEYDVEFDKLVSAAKESATVQDVIAQVRQGEAANLEDIGLTNEVIDKFFRHYYPLDNKARYTFRNNEYNVEGFLDRSYDFEWEGTGDEEEIIVVDGDGILEHVMAYKWIQHYQSLEGAGQTRMWIRIQNGTMSAYYEEPSEDNKAFCFYECSLKDKGNTTLELENTEMGETLKITTYMPMFQQRGTWWFLPGIGMVEYHAEIDNGERYESKLIQSLP